MSNLYQKLKNTSLSYRIIVGLILGVLLGLLVGERAAALQLIADVWIRLMQMTVIPYVMVSLMSGLGGLNRSLARKLAVRGGILLLLSWGIAFVVISVFPQVFPQLENAAFFSALVSDSSKGFNPLDLYIPANPFHSMANTIIPAVVFFSAAVGIALIGIPNKAVLIDGFKVLIEALSKVTHFMVGLTPVGVFAIAAVAAGTMTLAQLEQLEVYFVVYIVAALYLAFWVLPMLIATLTPFRYRDIFRHAQNALITAFLTQNLFIILPMLVDASKQLFEDYQLGSEETESLAEVIIPITFNFPNVGKLLSLLFVPYAAWQSGSAMEWGEYPSFLLAGLASYFAKAQVALPFLLDYQKLPDDLFQLYIPTGIINGKFDTMVSAMNLFMFSTVGAAALTGNLKYSLRKVLRLLWMSLLILVATLFATRVFLANVIDTHYDKDELIISMSLSRPLGNMKVYRNPEETGQLREPITPGPENRFQHIIDSGVLRAGYDPMRLPFTFFNERDQLVGFDVELLGLLAEELGVRLEMLPVRFENLTQALNQGEIDLFGTTPFSTNMLARVELSDAYLDGELSLVVNDHRKKLFNSFGRLKTLEHLTVAYVGSIQYVRRAAMRDYPEIDVIWKQIDNYKEFFEQAPGSYDALLTEIEIGTAWSLLYPSYTTVIVEGAKRKKMPLGFAVARGRNGFAQALDRWLLAKRAAGDIDHAYRYWILGEGTKKTERRWSVLDDVLGWGEESSGEP